MLHVPPLVSTIAVGLGLAFAFGVLAGFFLDGRLDAAKGDEFLRRQDRQDFDAATGLHRAAGGEAQSDLRLRTVVHHHQIDAHVVQPLSRLKRCSAAVYSGRTPFLVQQETALPALP